jgi:predicted neutral ceramidase superfamily lipid hydrolase
MFEFENLMHVDVLFSWLLLYTLASFVVFKHAYEDRLLLLNILVVVVTLEAGCEEANYDCQSAKIVIMAAYVVAMIIRLALQQIAFKVIMASLTLITLILATIFYFGGQHYRPSHSMWHVIGAVGATFAIVIHSDTELSIIGQDNEVEANPSEKLNLIRCRRDI